MATITQGNFITANVGADLSTKRYYVAKLDASNNAVLATAATDDLSGVLDDVPQKATGSCSIKHISANGTGKVMAGAAIAKGAYITVDGTGRAVTAAQTAAGSQPTKRVFGRTREAAAAAGDIIEFEHCFFLF